MPLTSPPTVEQIYLFPASKPVAQSKISGSVRSGQRLIHFSLCGLELTESIRIKLVLHGLQKTEESRVLRISLKSDRSVRLIAGNLYTYGEGKMDGIRDEERFFPLTLSLDITDAIQQLLGTDGADIFIDILDPHGRVLEDETLFMEGVEINMVGEHTKRRC